AALLMVVEMAVFSLAPRGNLSLLFALFLLNRILSGAAEASASGADEALAYDSLVADGRGDEWPRVLERLMRWQAAAFFLTMMLGAAVYDPRPAQAVLDALGLPWKASREVTMRFPLYLTLGNAVPPPGGVSRWKMRFWLCWQAWAFASRLSKSRPMPSPASPRPGRLGG